MNGRSSDFRARHFLFSLRVVTGILAEAATQSIRDFLQNGPFRFLVSKLGTSRAELDSNFWRYGIDYYHCSADHFCILLPGNRVIQPDGVETLRVYRIR